MVSWFYQKKSVPKKPVNLLLRLKTGDSYCVQTKKEVNEHFRSAKLTQT